jgi:hypothetical protein
MGWDISNQMVEELVAAKRPGVETRLQALAVFHHCSVHEISLFDFFERFQVSGLKLFPAQTVESVVTAAETRDPVPAPVSFAHVNWRDCVVSIDRLEALRKHIAEVKSAGVAVDQSQLQVLEEMERKLARVVEPVPTLGMVADDEEEDLSEYSSDPMSDEDDSAAVDDAASEQSEIASVLSNPQLAAATTEAGAAKKDSQGRVLVSAEMLEQIYAAGGRIGFTKEALRETACERFKLRTIEDLPEVIAEKFLQNRVVTVPGVAFGDEASGFLRISFCNSEERMAEGIARMKQALGI